MQNMDTRSFHIALPQAASALPSSSAHVPEFILYQLATKTHHNTAHICIDLLREPPSFRLLTYKYAYPGPKLSSLYSAKLYLEIIFVFGNINVYKPWIKQHRGILENSNLGMDVSLLMRRDEDNSFLTFTSLSQQWTESRCELHRGSCFPTTSLQKSQ